MKYQLSKIEFALWWLFKPQQKCLLNASNYTDWTAELIQSTEKAYQFKLDRPHRNAQADWLIWIPKSCIISFPEPLKD